MGQPNWSKIPFEKMPEWKRQEILAKSKKTVEVLEQNVTMKTAGGADDSNVACDKCQKTFKNSHGLLIHQAKCK